MPTNSRHIVFKILFTLFALYINRIESIYPNNKQIRNKIYLFKLKTNLYQVWFKFRSLMKESTTRKQVVSFFTQMPMKYKMWYIYNNIYKNTELITMWMSLYTFFNNIFNNSLYYISSWSTFLFLYKTFAFWLLIDLKRAWMHFESWKITDTFCWILFKDNWNKNTSRIPQVIIRSPSKPLLIWLCGRDE